MGAHGARDGAVCQATDAGCPHLDGLDGVLHLEQAALWAERVDATIILAASEEHNEAPAS